jgi:broad specificity phosphatase PhoE
MNNEVIFLRHFKTKIDKDKPVAEWDLDETGKAAMKELLEKFDFNVISKIISSPEHKAMITSKAISDKFGQSIIKEPLIAEVDRSKAGFIDGDYKEVVKEYFSSVDFEYAWESRDDVEKRIKKAVSNILAIEGTPLVISHGMYLSIMLSPCVKKDTITFWNNLGFGEIIKINKKDLEAVWK